MSAVRIRVFLFRGAVSGGNGIRDFFGGMMRQPIPNPFEDGECFFCGPSNEDGLKLEFFYDAEREEVSCDYVPERRFQGQGTVFHGGMQMGLLDEAMWWAGYAVTGIMQAVTVGAKFRFLRPVFIGKPVRIFCKVKKFEGDSIKLAGWIENAEGRKCTAVRGEFRVIGDDRYAQVVRGE